MNTQKKSLLALSLLAAAGSASAQSSVTIFGIVDAAISHYSVDSKPYGTSPAAGTPSTKRSQTALSNGSYFPSRIGFRGVEDLGNGLKASFWLESPLSNDDGSLPMVFSRRSTLSLSNGLGEVRLGRDYTPTFWMDTLYDPFNNIGVGGNIIGSVNGRLAVTSALSGGGLLNGGLPGGPDNYVRTSNSIGYFLPPNLGGFYGQLQYALHENVKSESVAGSPSKRGAEAAVRFGYDNGPFDVSGSYVQSTPVDGLLPSGLYTERKVKSAALGASYNFGPARLSGELSQVRDDLRSGVPGAVQGRANDRYDGAMVAVSVPLGVGLVRAAYSRVKFKDEPGPGAALAPAGDATASKLALGYVHNLSKRTALYATVARIRIGDGQNNPAVMGVGIGGTLAYVSSGGANGFAPRSATGFDFGIKHSF